ncbi:MAG: iron ABC transporter permease [Firmicutes bacterium]|nr:iron ABC transporter permease [Bacillota bacterium]
MRPPHKYVVLVLGLILLALVILVAVGVGSVNVAPAEMLSILRAVLKGADPAQLGGQAVVIVGLRLPRVILAGLVGAALAGAGVAFQALFQNPLADPYIVGVSAGAGLGATVVIGFGLTIVGSQVLAVNLSAFIGALGISYLVYRIAYSRQGVSNLLLLLAGMAVSAFLSAVISLVMVFGSRNLAETVYWLMGGFTGRGWSELWLAVPCISVGLAGLWFLRRELNMLLLPEDDARSLGVDVGRVKVLVLGAASLMAAAGVSVGGLIGFVGLVVPHGARLVVGPDHRYLFPTSVIYGAVVMILADLVARTALAPLELPVGAITALFGAPFFLYLLSQAKAGRR